MKIDREFNGSPHFIRWGILFLLLIVVLLYNWFSKEPEISPLNMADSTPLPEIVDPIQFSQKSGSASIDPNEIHQNTLPVKQGPQGYLGSDACMECHESEHASWHHSYHRSMTQLMTSETVQADFDDVELEMGEEIFTLFKKDEEYWVRITDRQPDSSPITPSDRPQGIELRMGMVTGSHHMQVFWLPAYHGNMQIGFPFTWLIKDERWVPRDSTFIRDPHSAASPEIWNLSCIRCHVTAGVPGHDRNTDQILSTAADLGISCEACHGPGEGHVQWHDQVAEAKASGNVLPERKDPIIQPDSLSAERSTQVCGQCHGMKWWDEKEAWRQTGFDYRPGDDLTATTPMIQPTKMDELPWLQQIVEKNPSLLRDFFWPDGMMRVSGREYNGLLETACHQNGDMSCVSCHSMHKSDPDDMLAKKMETNQACLQCHSNYKTNLSAHTHHAEESQGSQCYNCHMPHTSFSLLGAIRSHQVDSPDVAASTATGRPNACNLCHADQSLQWTAEVLNEWYEKPIPEVPNEDQDISSVLKHLLQGDAGQRALAAWHLGWSSSKEVSGHHWQPRFLAELLDDPYAAVRYVAYKALKSFSGFESFGYDYVASSKQLQEAQSRAIGIWEEQGHAFPVAQSRQVLLDDSGRVYSEQLQALLDKRDDTPIRLRE